MKEELSLSTLLVFLCIIAMILLLLTGCSNRYEECLEQEKAAYRERNPKASYGQILSRQSEFERECSQHRPR